METVVQKTKVSYDEVHDLAWELAEGLRGETYDCIVSIGRNGLFLAHQLSYYLGIRDIVNVTVQKYQQEGDGLTLWSDEVAVARSTFGKRVLIVDLVLDTGSTAKKVLDTFSKLAQWKSPLFVCLYSTEKKKLLDREAFFVMREIGEDAWIEFPWEGQVDD